MLTRFYLQLIGVPIVDFWILQEKSVPLPQSWKLIHQVPPENYLQTQVKIKGQTEEADHLKDTGFILLLKLFECFVTHVGIYLGNGLFFFERCSLITVTVCSSQKYE